MFIELHQFNGKAITINLNRVEYFVPIVNSNDKGTGVSIINNVTNSCGWFTVTESYEQVKELIEKCLKK